MDSDSDLLEPIAVVGLSFKYPQDAVSPESFWEMLASGRCASTKIPEDRWNAEAFATPDGQKRVGFAPKAGHFIKEDLAVFDAPFFSITPAEATAMDPHQRIILEQVYRGFESAGIPIEKVKGTDVSVHTSSFADDYRLRTFRDPDELPRYCATGTEIGMLSNRVSWFYDFHGPSTNLDSACSGSLMALDHACATLRAKDATMSVVASGALVMDPENVISLANMGFLSPDGRCFSFDHRANGYAKGEGVGCVVLQRFSDAVREGNPIRAVIRGTHANSNGYNPGITQPSQKTQEALIRRTYEKAGLTMLDTKYAEGHGTGTAIGDIAEANGLGTAFKNRPGADPLIIGCVKSNIGHLEGGAGIAGLIKTVLVLESGVIPPNTNFVKPPPEIDTAELDIEFPLECLPFPTTGLRRASINSFGFGGTNAHAILDDAYNYCRSRGITAVHRTRPLPPSKEELSDPKFSTNFFSIVSGKSACGHADNTSHHTNGVSTPTSNGVKSNSYANGNGHVSNGNGHNTNGHDANGHNGSAAQHKDNIPRILVLSAADSKGVDRLSNAYHGHLQKIESHFDHRKEYLDDLAYTLANHRSRLLWRSFQLSNSAQQLSQNGLAPCPPVRSMSNPGLCLVFSGQGAQWAQMAKDLCKYDTFWESLRTCEKYLQNMGSQWLLRDELFLDDTNTRIHQADFSQPICTAVQIALVDLLRTFSITPSLVIGHSSGEIAAAYCNGALSCESALKVAFHRGRLAAELSRAGQHVGAMLAVRLTASETIPYLEILRSSYGVCEVAIGCYNSPNSLTMTGSKQQIVALKDMLVKEGIFARELRVDVAYHSQHMQHIAIDYLRAIQHLEPGTVVGPQPQMLSTVTTSIVSPKALRQSYYWVANLISPVRFSQTVQRILTASGDLIAPVHQFLEVGPHAVMKGPIGEISRSLSSANKPDYSSTLVRGSSGITTMLESLGHLWCAGVDVDLTAVNKQASNGHKPTLLIDLPEYPFDHSQRYAITGRFDYQYRNRRHGKNKLLGTPVVDYNQHDAVWRNRFQPSEMPWLNEHKIEGAVLYPAPGMIVMAIEAMNQAADEELEVTGFDTRNVVFHHSLRIPEEGKETRLSLRQLRDDSNKPSAWHEFIIYVYEENEFRENCRGQIRAEYGQRSLQSATAPYKNTFENAKKACNTNVQKQRYYQNLKACGLNYGPEFQRLSNIRYGGADEAVAEVSSFESSELSFDRVNTHVVHTTTLDAVWHSMFIPLTKGATVAMPANIPTRIDRMWISKDGMRYPESLSADVHSRCERLSPRTARSSVSVLSKENGEPLVVLTGLQTTTIGDVEAASMMDAEQKYCFTPKVQPDITLLSKAQQQAYFRDLPQIDGSLDFFHQLTIFMLETLRRTRLALTDIDVSSLSPHLHRYIDWMEQFPETGATAKKVDFESARLNLGDDIAYQKLGVKLATTSALGKLFVEVGRNLEDIFRGTCNMHELLFSGTLVADYYQDVYNQTNFNSHLAPYLELLAHKRPGLKILEIGAGTGGATSAMLRNLSGKIGRYTFTDLSPSFFNAAREKLGEDAELLDFSIFDIEKSPESQGLEIGSYDLVVAFSVLHLADDLDAAMQHARKLLNPGGKLIMSEIVRPEILRGSFIWGLFPEWWKGTEEDRQMGPCVSESRWDGLLATNGFTGLDLVVRDYNHEACHEMSMLISSATQNDRDSSPLPPVSLIFNEDSIAQMGLAAEVKSQLQASGFDRVSTVPLDALTSNIPSADNWCISLANFDDDVLLDLQTASFASVKSLLLSSRNLIWVSGGSQDTNPAAHGIINGLSRTVRNERSDLKMVTLSLEPGTSHSSAAEHISSILRKSLENIDNKQSIEEEYVERNGTLQISRLVQEQEIESAMTKQQLPLEPELRPLSHDKSLRLEIGHPGVLSSLRFVEAEPEQALGPDEVEIKVMAAGLNASDLLAASGKIDRNWLGSDCAGIITRSNNDSFKSGESVMAVCPGSLQTQARTKASLISHMPQSLDFVTAASVPTIFSLAYHALIDIAQIESGESILVHCGTSALGQAVIQVAQAHGAEVFATASSEEKKQFLVDKFGVSQERILNSRDTSFAKAVQGLTSGRGVDVVMDPFLDARSEASMECIASSGRYIDIALGGAVRNLVASRDNVSYTRLNFGTLLQTRPKPIQRALSKVQELFAAGTLKSVVSVDKFPASQVEAAFQSLQSGTRIGKAVVEFVENDQIKVLSNESLRTSLDPHSTYVVSGGLGGLGKDVTEWLVGCGAKHLILLSRSGLTEKNAPFVEQLQKQGIQVATPACDISDEAAVNSALSQCADMPPIKGCIQAAVVMEDLTFERVSVESWRKVTRPKIQGTWNLHNLLPRDLDFFIMLSSMIGMFGNASQASYAAGNTYQDALAAHCHSLGLKATSLDLGPVGEIGQLAEDLNMRSHVESSGYFTMLSPKDIHLSLKYAIEGGQKQLLTGINIPAKLQAAGRSIPYWMERGLFGHLHQIGARDSAAESNESKTDLSNLLTSATDAEATNIVADALVEKLARILGAQAENFDSRQKMSSFGVDSMVAVDVRNWFAKEVQADVAIFDILGSKQLVEVAAMAAGQSQLRNKQ